MSMGAASLRFPLACLQLAYECAGGQRLTPGRGSRRAGRVASRRSSLPANLSSCTASRRPRVAGPWRARALGSNPGAASCDTRVAHPSSSGRSSLLSDPRRRPAAGAGEVLPRALSAESPNPGRSWSARPDCPSRGGQAHVARPAWGSGQERTGRSTLEAEAMALQTIGKLAEKLSTEGP